MAVNFPPYYTSQILNADGKPVAGGLIRAYLTGTETPAPLYSSDGTPLGSSVSIDAAGNAVFCLRVGTTYRLRCIDADGAVVWTRDGVRALGETAGIENPMTAAGDMIVGAAGGEPARLAPGDEGDALKIVGGVPTWTTDQTGMANPMTTKGDLIVGATGGEPDRLGVGADGDILASALFAGNLSPTWEAGPKKYRNVYGDLPSPQIDDGYLGCLFYLSSAGQTLNLPAAATFPAKSFIDFVCIDDAATLTITPQGTTTLNGQGSAVTIGGKSASFYRLTFLGHGGSGDEWAVGGTDTATQPGDHKTAVDGADASPDYLANKLSAGTGISLTNTGSAVQIAATAQTGDHQLLVSATDASAGYLGAKLTAGSNVTLTTQTDLDGVQSIEISAAGGGGGGGGGSSSVWSVLPTDNLPSTAYASGSGSKTVVHKMFVSTITPKSVAFALTRNSANYPMDVSVGIYTSGRQLCYFGSATYSTYSIDLTWDSSGAPLFNIPVSAVATAPKTEFDNGEIVWLAITILWHGGGAPSYRCAQGIKTSIYSTSNVTASLTMLPTPSGAILDYTPCVGILG